MGRPYLPEALATLTMDHQAPDPCIRQDHPEAGVTDLRTQALAMRASLEVLPRDLDPLAPPMEDIPAMAHLRGRDSLVPDLLTDQIR
jgi:hypothetical protein